MTRDSSLDVAITGLAARFPGPARLEEWWDGIVGGRTFLADLDRDQLIGAGLAEDLLDDPSYVPVHGRLAGTDAFDNDFFGISPREARRLDPQHRLTLEVAWQALEDACVPPNKPAGRTGVFASCTGSGYLRAILARGGQPDPATLDDLIHGTEPDFLASRISYKLGLTGPAMAVQTACSSSLVALHLAVQALINGDCEEALVVAAGIAYPQAGYLHLPGGVLSPTGRCRPFDRSADGVVPGSGVACVVLRRADDVRARDVTPHGIILGTAVNNDGSNKAGYYAPSAQGQERAIRDALAAAGIEASSIGYLEAHGTGTFIGDPIEWHAASAALRTKKAVPGQVAVGAVKANVGHLDACAGLAALIKTLFVLKTGIVPPIAGFTQLNPLLATDDSPLFIPENAVPWRGPQPRRAGVSSFGIGGTNAHVVVEAARPSAPSPADERPRVMVLSAAGADALERLAESVGSHLEATAEPLADVSYTLVNGRAELSHRLAFAASSTQEASARLRRPQTVARGCVPVSGASPLIFVFPGQGTQSPGMALPYRTALPGFADALDDCLGCVAEPLRSRLRDALFSPAFPADEFSRTELAQPAIACTQIAIVAALEEVGVRPGALIGHSLGEIAAASAAGILGLRDAITLVIERGRAMQACPPGAMLALSCSDSHAREMIEGTGLEIASVNGPDNCVIGGSSAEIAEFARRHGASTPSRLLRTSHAFHTRLIDDAMPALRAVAARLPMKPARRPFVSVADAAIFEVGQIPDPSIWARSARVTVRFGAALDLLKERVDKATALEIGPGRALSPALYAAGVPAISLGSRPGAGTAMDVLSGLGELWAAGHGVALATLAAGGRATRLPPYPFDGPRHLPELARGAAPRDVPSADRGRSPAGWDSAPARSDRRAREDDPRDNVAGVVTGAWREFLGRDDVTETMEFFDLGGDSLLITRMVRHLNQVFDRRLPVRELLAARTLAGHIGVIETLLREDR